MRKRMNDWIGERARLVTILGRGAALLALVSIGCTASGGAGDPNAQAGGGQGGGAAAARPDSRAAQPPQGSGGEGARHTFRTMPDADPASELAEKLREGATMEEIAQLRDPIATNPAEALRELKAGNGRFYGGVAHRPDLSANERRAQILGQTPFAIVLGCSDSRVPTEIVYDQNFGSLFVVRVAGNIAEPATLGSIEYAIAHLKSQILVVMGHEGCGAVSAAMLPDDEQAAEPANVRFLLEQIRPSVSNVPPLRDKKARMREAVIANVRLQVHRVRQNPVVSAAEKAGKLRVVGAYYEIGSGAMDFLERDDELRLTAEEQRRAAEGLRAAGAAARESMRQALLARLRR